MAAPLLKPGARVAVVSPSGVHDPARLEAGLTLIRSWGLRPVMGRNVAARFRYTAGSSAERGEDLVWALTAPISMRSGSLGADSGPHLLEAIPWPRSTTDPSSGSRMTALFTAMTVRGAGCGVHGPVLHSLADHPDERSRERLHRSTKGASRLSPRHLTGPDVTIEGPLVGGNLCVLASLVGTPFALRARGKVLLLEEIGERPYQVDRLVTQLRLGGVLDGVLGIALGEFIAPRHSADADIDMNAVLRDLLAPLGVPVIAGLPIGHGAANSTVRLGAPVRLDGEGLHVG